MVNQETERTNRMIATSMHSFVETRPTAAQRRKSARERVLRRKQAFTQKYRDEAAVLSEIEIAENDSEILAHKIEHQKVHYGPDPDFLRLWDEVEDEWLKNAMEYNTQFHTLDNPLESSKAMFRKASDLLTAPTNNDSKTGNLLLGLLPIDARVAILSQLENSYLADMSDAFREDAEDLSCLEYAIENNILFKHPWSNTDGPSYFEECWSNYSAIEGDKREILETIREELGLLGVGKFTIRYAQMYHTQYESPTCLNFSFWDQERRVVRCVWHGNDSWSGPFVVEGTAEAGIQTWSKFKTSNGERVTDAEEAEDEVTRYWVPCYGHCEIKEDPMRIKQIALDIAASSLM